ncbi:hypothetical protein [Limosilactobacillus reuteri]|uniref:hypothetical protein n=1 Tax=Limosilactobacillus reuteri TaxID=1598 RepID=UPI003990743B
MTENNQLSDETKNNSTDTSSTDVSSAVIGNHENAIVPHKISNHDKLVQTMVMVDGEWINVNDTNDQANVKYDMHKVNKKVVEAQKGIVEAKNTADSAVKYADSAVSASKVNSDALVAQSSAIREAKSAMDSANAAIQQTAANAASDAAKIRADVAQVQSEVDTAKAANSATVEALKSDVSAAKQDIQAARQANENVAKQLDDYTKQAQAQGKTIKDIQNAQDGYTATLADVKGNVSKISDAVDGLSASLKDDQDNVATIKVKADELSATLTDHDKNIAQLTASAKELSSTLEDADGRLSKVEQTASTLVSEFSDQQGYLNKIEQTAQGTEQTVANQQGQINDIKTDAAGMHQTLTGQGNQIANINVTLNGLSSRYEGVSDDLGKLKDQTDWKIVTGAFDANQYTQTARIFYQDTYAKNTPNVGWFYLIVDAPRSDRITQTLIKDNSTDTWTRVYNGSWEAWTKGATNLDITNLSNRITTNSTQITQNKQAIALKADQSSVNNLSGEVSQNKAQLKVQADQISSKVSSEGFNTLDNKVSGAIAQINKNTTAIDQTNKQISLKADQTEVDNVKNMAQQNSSRLDVMDNKIQSKVTSTDVNNIINEKGFTTQSTVQSLIEQKAGTLNESITKLSNDTVTHFQSITASLDGLQTNVTNYQNDTTSKYTQLSNLMQSKVGTADFEQLKRSVDMQILDYADINNMKTNGHYFVHNLTGNPVGGWVYVDVTGNGNDRIRQDVYQDSSTKHAFRRWFGSYWTGWSTGAEESEITQLRNDINLRVKSGDLLSQINIAAGHTLIQSNKIYFDADSFVMSPNSTAFIPSAYITDINADKITTGTLDAAKFNVKNFSADNITGGTLNGVVVKTGANDRYFQTSKDNIYWVRNDDMSLVGNDTYLNRANGLNIADINNIQLTTWGGASVNPDGSIVNTSGNAGHPKIVVDTNGNWDPDDPYGTKWGGGPGDNEIAQWVGNKEYTVLTRNQGFTVHLNDGNSNSKFSIQKDNKVGFYVGDGDNSNQVNVTLVGDGSGFNIRGNFNVYGAKNSAVKTSQGDVAVSAYETAEYYFGDIGEAQTGDSGIAFVGIEKLFSETVNTSIPYQVFITAYGPGNLWVDQREHDRFVVKSDRSNVKFGWEIKAKQRGYENTRLQKVN